LSGADVTLKSNKSDAGALSTTFATLTNRTAGNTANIVSSGGTPGTDTASDLLAINSNLTQGTGATDVTGGTLLVNNTSGSATGSGAVSVASGAALGGNG